MATSSAKPANLLAYRDGGLAQVEAWEPEVAALDTALSDLRSALSGLDLPEECQVSVLFYETWFDSLTRNQRHLDEWVGDVANGFIRAAGGDPADFEPGEGLGVTMTVADSAIVVGFADRYRSERQAAEDAAALDAILGGAGLVHPYDIANDPERLEELASQYPELRDILARTARFATDEAYAAALVNELGPRNVRTMADLTNTFGLAHDQGMLGGDPYAGYVVPLAVLLGNADRSGRMDRSVRDAIFDMDATDEPPIADTNTNDIIEGQLADMRYRSLALLVHAGDFSPRTTADMADAILNEGPVHPEFYDYTGFTDPLLLDQHPELASNEWAAADALARDDAAANVFYRMGDHRNLGVMGVSPGAETAAERLGVPVEEISPRIEQAIADSLHGGLLDHPLTTGTTYSTETTEAVAAMIDVAGWEHMDASDAAREAMAEISTPYTLDIAVASYGGGPDVPASRLPGVDQAGVDAFMREVSESRDARLVLSQNAAALVHDEVSQEAENIVAGNGQAFGTGERLAAAYYRDMGEAWDDVQIGWVEQRESLVAGWRSVTDPVVDLVSGKIVERIPVVNTAAQLPLVSNVVDGITGGIKDGINDAVYENLIPRPELEAMTTWRDGIGPEVNTAVARGIYDHPETRQHFLTQAQADEPDLWAQINADGEVTLDEFRTIREVRNAVNTFGGEIVDGFQAQMAFDKSEG